MANSSQSMINSDRNTTIVYVDPPGTTAFIVVLFFLIVATILTNSAVFFAVYAFRGLRTVTNCFVISLASADLAVALLAMPTWLIRSLLRLHTDDAVFVLDVSTSWVDVFCCAASIFNAVLVSIDRYLAINKPLRYRELVTRRRAIRSIIGAWVISLIVAAISYIQLLGVDGIYGFATFLFVLIFCIPLCIMCFCYVFIYRAAVGQLSKMANNGHILSLSGEEDKQKFLVAERRKRFYKELRITKTLTVTVSLFVIAWAPFLLITLIETYNHHFRVPFEVEVIVVWAPYVNSFANPLIYTGINKDFRKALKKLLCSRDSICACLHEDERASASRSLVGSVHGDADTATTSFNRGSNSRRLEMQCTSL